VLDAAENGALAAPGRRGGGGGSRGGSRSSSSSRGSSWGRSKPSGSGGYKKKSSTKSKLKKAAIVGAGVYGGYQLGKLTSKFSGYRGGGGWGYSDYNKWREVDGFLCRNTQDCNWIDNDLYCQDYELDFEPSALWFGGDVARIVGECACPRGMVFNNRELECQTAVFGTGALIAVVFVGILMLLCACGCCFFAARKFF